MSDFFMKNGTVPAEFFHIACAAISHVYISAVLSDAETAMAKDETALIAPNLSVSPDSDFLSYNQMINRAWAEIEAILGCKIGMNTPTGAGAVAYYAWYARSNFGNATGILGVPGMKEAIEALPASTAAHLNEMSYPKIWRYRLKGAMVEYYQV